MFSKKNKKQKDDSLERPNEENSLDAGNQTNQSERQRQTPKPSMSNYIAGETKDFVSNLNPYLPHELVGGSVPYIAGTEEEAVWNAASQACGTEKVNYTYTVEDKYCWYIACPSSSLSSNPDTWCPLAAALPGNSEYWDKEPEPKEIKDQLRR